MEKATKSSTREMEYDYLQASSIQDCTGLIPRGIMDESEVENYQEIYPFLPKVVRPDDLSAESD